MSRDSTGIPRSLRISAILLVLGLSTEGISLHWVHPLAFIAFFVIGGTFLAAGVLLFLYSLVAMPTARDTQDS
jgi:hypothetical protein